MSHIWSPSWENVPGITSAPWVRCQKLQFGVPTYNPRMQTGIISLWANSSSGFMLMLFVLSCKTLNVAKPGAWLARPPPVQFSHSVVSDSLWPHGLQHVSLPCPSLTPEACSNSCPLSWWCHPTISFSVIAFSSCLQSFPGSGSFSMNQLFASGGKRLEIQLQHQTFQWIFRTDFL